MATTQEFYRGRTRNPRFSTKLNSMANGMYLTDQNIPEGFAKVLVNYDIDDTGSNIRNRNGRELIKTIQYKDRYKHRFDALHLSDYLYEYDTTGKVVTDTKDTMLSFGHYDDLSYYVGKNYAQELALKTNNDLNNYYGLIELKYFNPDTNEISVSEYNNLWALNCDKNSEDFNKINNRDIGIVTSRVIKNSYAFDKKVCKDITRPIFTVFNNEVYAFTAPKVRMMLNTKRAEDSFFESFSKPILTKLKIQEEQVLDLVNEDVSFPTISRNEIIPKQLNPIEASTVGFNMLSPSPYLFKDVSGGSPNILGVLMYPSSTSDIPVLSPNLYETIAFRIYYQYNVTGTTMQYKIEEKDANTLGNEYMTAVDWTDFTSGDALWTNEYIIPYSKTYLKITIRIKDDAATESVTPYLIDTTTNKVELKEHDLTTAKGMTNWLGCLGLYGVKDAPDSIFFSDIDDPSYFPYPANKISFGNDILAVHKYLNMLIVITTDSIYLLSPGPTISQSIVKQILTNVYIPEIDAINAVVLKDQIFFKTDTRFYVLKPNSYTSDATDLKNFDNSTAIANYTINFTKETLDVFNKVYRSVLEDNMSFTKVKYEFFDFRVHDIQSVVIGPDVHYIYSLAMITKDPDIKDPNKALKLEPADLVNIDILYNTITRSFRFYIKAVGNDNINPDIVFTEPLENYNGTIRCNQIYYRNKQSGAYYELAAESKEHPEIPLNDCNAAIAVIKNSQDIVDDNLYINDVPIAFNFNNFQYLDTGNVAIEDMYLKRFREVQFNILNKERDCINFYADFKVDGRLRIPSSDYKVNQITDPQDPDYGLIYVEPSSETNITVDGMTALDSRRAPEQLWQIDLSRFPELSINTVRMQTLGKGRRCSIELLSTSLKKFNLSTMVWVYRIMNVR